MSPTIGGPLLPIVINGVMELNGPLSMAKKNRVSLKIQEKTGIPTRWAPKPIVINGVKQV